jgi:hypothetical protein
MSDGFVAFIFSLGIAGFIYANVARRVGNSNGKTSAIAAAAIFVIAYTFIFTLMKYVLHI